MVSEFQTSQSGPSKTGGASKLFLIAVLIAGVYVGYKYILKPKLEKRKENEQN
tara:strand:+ start:4333 stop:4491 length:159 start_codon:yes stop_codon:yes gene_type:complete